MIVKVCITLKVDEDEYPMPADGFVDEEVREAIQEFIYDIDGMEIKAMKTITE